LVSLTDIPLAGPIAVAATDKFIGLDLDALLANEMKEGDLRLLIVRTSVGPRDCRLEATVISERIVQPKSLPHRAKLHLSNLIIRPELIKIDRLGLAGGGLGVCGVEKSGGENQREGSENFLVKPHSK